MLKPGFKLPSHIDTKLKGWKPANLKPTKNELWQAVMLRDPSSLCKNWEVHKLVEALLKLPVTGPAPDAAEEEPELEPEPGQQPGPAAGGPVPRWSNNKLVRVFLHEC